VQLARGEDDLPLPGLLQKVGRAVRLVVGGEAAQDEEGAEGLRVVLELHVVVGLEVLEGVERGESSADRRFGRGLTVVFRASQRPRIPATLAASGSRTTMDVSRRRITVRVSRTIWKGWRFWESTTSATRAASMGICGRGAKGYMRAMWGGMLYISSSRQICRSR